MLFIIYEQKTHQLNIHPFRATRDFIIGIIGIRTEGFFAGKYTRLDVFAKRLKSYSNTLSNFNSFKMVHPLAAGVSVAAVALASKYAIEAWQAFKARPVVPRMRKFYEGGFQPVMTRREAALILGVRERVAMEKIKEAHRRVMVANHPDSGGSDYLASKINEAKDVMLGQNKGSGSPF